MSVRQGNKVIAGHINYHPDLFDHKWADHMLNDVSWLRADTFSWQDGGVYSAAYDHLADDIDGKSTQTETVGGITITFYLADDGHKICPASEESNVVSIYNATGVAWYYIIDTTNQRFKLPRTKWGMMGLRGNVNDYVEQSVLLPKIIGTMYNVLIGSAGTGADGSLYIENQRNYAIKNDGTNEFEINVKLDASRSSAVYSGDGTNTLIQPRATQQYLYFYVGNFTQTALENTAGITAETLNDKADKTDAVGFCSFNTNTRVQITTTNQTAAKNGWLLGFFAYTGNNSAGKIYVNDIEVSRGSTSTSTQWGNVSVQIPVKAGQTYKYGLDSGATLQTNQMYFYPND